MDQLKKVLAAPSDSTVRQVEHVVALLAAVQLTRSVISLGPRGVLKKVMGVVLSTARAVPGLKDAVEGEENELMGKLETEFLGIVPDADAHRSLPEKGASADDIISECQALQVTETKYSKAKTHAGIYYHGADELAALQKSIYQQFLTSNLLYPGVFKSCRKFEAEVCSMVASMVHGCCASFASGGSEAVFLAVKAHREWATAVKGITEPEIVSATTAHPCLDKACFLLRVKLVKVPVDSEFLMDVKATSKAINRNTIMVYASAPTFPHGVVDPIEDLAKLTTAAKIGLHVDNCLGGFLVSHLQLIGKFTRPFDFKVPGVTSMTVDVHKFGCAPKGASIIVYHSEEMRRFQYYCMVEWPGGLYATPTVQGSRPGASPAGAWATLVHIGREGYADRARRYAAATERVVKEINSMPGLRVLGSPDACAVAFTSDTYNIYGLASKVEERGGWSITGLQEPAAVHILMGERILDVLDDILADIRAVAEELAANPSAPATGTLVAMYGNNAMLPKEEMESSLKKYLDLCYKVSPKPSMS